MPLGQSHLSERKWPLCHKVGFSLEQPRWLRSRDHSLLVMQCSAGKRRFLRRPCSTERTDGRCTSCSTKRWDCNRVRDVIWRVGRAGECNIGLEVNSRGTRQGGLGLAWKEARPATFLAARSS